MTSQSMTSFVNGEVRWLADIFPVAEAESASKHVADALRIQCYELQTLEEYFKDNRGLSKLIQGLPHKTSYNIMVPFGKGAFFPGRMLHTNEFLVLLGEGYYSECSAKQAVDILDRRSKFLESKMAGVKSQISDLQAESLFFSNTMAEAAAGVLEIREEYVEPSSLKMPHGSFAVLGEPILTESDFDGNESGLARQSTIEVSDEDDEHQRIMARLTELELAEAAAEAEKSEGDEDDSFKLISQDADYEPVPLDSRKLEGENNKALWETGGNNDSEDDHLEIEPNTSKNFISKTYADVHSLQSEALGSLRNVGFSLSKDKEKVSGSSSWATLIEEEKGIKPSNRNFIITGPGDLLKFEEWRQKNLMSESVLQQGKNTEMDPLITPHGTSKMIKDVNKHQVPARVITQKEEESQRSFGTSQPQRAFTGTVVERIGPILPDNNISKELPESQTRPTSRFKMRQVGR